MEEGLRRSRPDLAAMVVPRYYTMYHEVQPVPMLVKDTALVCQE